MEYYKWKLVELRLTNTQPGRGFLQQDGQHLIYRGLLNLGDHELRHVTMTLHNHMAIGAYATVEIED